MEKCKRTFAIILSGLCFSGILSAQEYPFQNPKRSIDERVDNIISLMNLEEKIKCLGTDPSVPRLGIKGSKHVEGLHGLAKGGPSNWGQRDPVTTTIFPQAIGLAESWDPEMMKRVASIESYETRYIFQSPKYKKGGIVVRAPNADLGRDPRWGRTEECYGEDAWFNGVMTVAFVSGLQGDDPKYWMTASLMKHFLANSNENGRDSTSSNFDERLLREYYAYPFWRGVVEGGSRAYMASYNAYNGIPMTVHPILKDITVKEWGQDGIICTDGGAFRLLLTAHKYYTDNSIAAANCIRAGINQFLDRYREGVDGSLKNGSITETAIDSVIKGNFRVMIKLGLLDPPEMTHYSSIGIRDTTDPWLTKEHQTAAREVTQKTIVLLKNSKNLLPLDKKKIKSLAVIGPHADQVLLDWYSGTPPYTCSPLAGIKNKVGESVDLKYTKNNIHGAAVALAKTVDVAIVIVGNHPTCDGAPFGECSTPSDGREAIDRKVIILEQEELIKEVYSANPNTIVVLVSSFPYAINWTQENVPAILHMTHASQEMGSALADVLFGDYNPGGRLVQTWPTSMDQLPPMMDYNIRNGHTYMYFKGEPLYPFGFGLSYTTFKYSNLEVSSKKLKSDSEIIARVTIENSGKRTGDEVVQLYIRHLNSKVDRPLKEIKGFKRVTLKPNESTIVGIPLKAEILSYWNIDKHSFVVEEDKIQLMIGPSSSDVKLQDTIDVVR
jgi:beta-glucosidase